MLCMNVEVKNRSVCRCAVCPVQPPAVPYKCPTYATQPHYKYSAAVQRLLLCPPLAPRGHKRNRCRAQIKPARTRTAGRAWCLSLRESTLTRNRASPPSIGTMPHLTHIAPRYAGHLKSPGLAPLAPRDEERSSSTYRSATRIEDGKRMSD